MFVRTFVRSFVCSFVRCSDVAVGVSVVVFVVVIVVCVVYVRASLICLRSAILLYGVKRKVATSTNVMCAMVVFADELLTSGLQAGRCPARFLWLLTIVFFEMLGTVD